MELYFITFTEADFSGSKLMTCWSEYGEDYNVNVGKFIFHITKNIFSLWKNASNVSKEHEDFIFRELDFSEGRNV